MSRYSKVKSQLQTYQKVWLLSPESASLTTQLLSQKGKWSWRRAKNNMKIPQKGQSIIVWTKDLSENHRSKARIGIVRIQSSKQFTKIRVFTMQTHRLLSQSQILQRILESTLKTPSIDKPSCILSRRKNKEWRPLESFTKKMSELDLQYQKIINSI